MAVSGSGNIRCGGNFLTLHSLGRQYQWKAGAEIGVWRGGTSWYLVNVLPIEKLYLIDPWRYENIDFELSKESKLPQRMPEGRYKITMGEKNPVSCQEDMDRMYSEVCRRFEIFGNRIKILRQAGEAAAKSIPDDSLDFAYIDSVHMYDFVMNDCHSYWPKIKPGGILCGDDWCNDFQEVAPAVTEFARQVRIKKVHVKGAVWWIQKRKASFIQRFLGSATN